MKDLDVAVFSCYMKNVNPFVVWRQRRVVKHFWPHCSLNQILTDKRHPDAMVEFLEKNMHRDYIIFLDIDAIPLSSNSYDLIISLTDEGRTIAGSPQRTMRKQNGEHVFVGPSTLCIAPKLWEELGRPSPTETKRGDVAEEWTWALEEKLNRQIVTFDVASWEPVPGGKRWFLKPPVEYGINTVYAYQNNSVFFHSFQGRRKLQQLRFVIKTFECLGWKAK